MKFRSLWIATLLIAALGVGYAKAASVPGDRVLLLANQRDPSSMEAARGYAARYGIPEANLCVLDASVSSVVTRSDFTESIQVPTIDCIRTLGAQDRIVLLVLASGLPLTIQGDPGAFGDLASVDSELSLLYRRMVGDEISPFGKVRSPYFPRDGLGADLPRFRRQDHDIYLVGRLGRSQGSGPTAQTAVSDGGSGSAATFAFDLSSQRRSLVRSWSEETRTALDRAGRELVVEETTGWMAASAPLAGLAMEVPSGELAVLPDWRWSPGAVAIVLGDTWTERGCDPAKGEEGDSLCVRVIPEQLIQQGAAAVLYQVGDPGQDGYPRPQVFFPALLRGLSVVEAAFLASRYVGWRLVVQGDPLAIPFPNPANPAPEWTDSVDPDSGLPSLLSQRRTTLLSRKYRTSPEAVTALLSAEAAVDREQPGEAMEHLARALELEPRLAEAVMLRARILEEEGFYREAVEALRRALELGGVAEEETHRKLAKLALSQLDDPELALPHAGWLFQRHGLRDLEAARLWLEVKVGLAEWRDVESLALRLVRGQSRPPAFALVALGGSSEAKGDLATAVRFYKRALDAADLEVEDPVRAEQVRERVAGIEARLAQVEAAPPSDPEGEDQTAETARTEQIERARVVTRTPLELRGRSVRSGEGGRVVLRLLIDERGQLLKVTPLAGPKHLFKVAEEAVRQWTFAPKLVDGRPEVDSINVALNFERPQTRD